MAEQKIGCLWNLKFKTLNLNFIRRGCHHDEYKSNDKWQSEIVPNHQIYSFSMPVKCIVILWYRDQKLEKWKHKREVRLEVNQELINLNTVWKGLQTESKYQWWQSLNDKQPMSS